MDFLEGVGEFMAREGIVELEILDGERVIRLRRGSLQPPLANEEQEESVVSAPLGGILRLSPSPGDPAYAPVGHTRMENEVLFCIEAMKHLNEVRAEFDLLVEETLAREGESVTEGQAVMRVRRLRGKREKGA